MAIRRRITTTGIYKQVERTIGTVDSRHGKRIIVADSDHIIARQRKLADLEPKHWVQHAKRRAAGAMRGVQPRATPKMSMDPERMLSWIERMEKDRDDGRVDKAIWRAFVVGRFFEYMHVRQHEPNVLLGRKSRKNKSEGGKTTAQLRRNNWRVWLAKYHEKVRSVEPKPSLSSVSKSISKDLEDTIYKGHKDTIEKRLRQLLNSGDGS